MRAVKPFRLKALRQTEVHHRAIRRLGKLHRLIRQRVVRGVKALKALREADPRREKFIQHGQRVIHLRGVDHAAARALIAGARRKLADNRHARVLLQRQQVLVVLQQHKALFRRRFRRLMLLGGIKRRFAGGLARCQHEIQQLIHALIDDFLVDCAVLDRLHQLAGAVVARRGHLQIHALAHALDNAVAAAPVGHDRAVKAPLAAQNIAQQMAVFVGVHAVDAVVCRHHEARLALFDGKLEVRQVHFPQRPLIHHAVGVHPQQLLRVRRVVLCAGGYALLLRAADEARRQLAGEVWIFGVILEAAAAQAGALRVQPRRKQHIHPLIGSVAPDDRAHRLGHRVVPAARQRRGGGNARRLRRCVKAQMVAFARLLAQTARPVGERDGGNIQPRNLARVPDIFAGKQGALFLQSHLGNQITVFHVHSILTRLHRPPTVLFSYFIIAIFSGDASNLAQTVEIPAQAVIFVLISCVYTISGAVRRVGAMFESGRKRELQRKNGMLSVDFDVRDAGVFPLTQQENFAIIESVRR